MRSCIVSLIVMLAIANSAWAQQGVDVQAPGVRVHTNDHQHDATDADENESATSERIVRVSDLVGTNVQNEADETVGEINDIVIDPDTGRVQYVALSVGGFLGVADQLFAIPWHSFECRRDGDDHVVVLDVNKETLQKAKGFNEDNWPDFSNRGWRSENDRLFVPRTRRVR